MGHCWTNSIDFGECTLFSFFYKSTKKNFIHYGLWSQILKSVLVSKQFIRFNSNLMCILKVTELRILLILGEFKIYNTFTGKQQQQQQNLMHCNLWSESIKNTLCLTGAFD